ncbi:autophagy protein 17 [Lignoscripta atroalba]|nr:autophagy protein 17 [Lignoscripta atroalba]
MSASTSSLPPQPQPQPLSSSSSPSLDTLVSHLLASKRSFSSITHVYRANELVTSTRQSLQSHTITAARTAFLRNGVTSQLYILDAVRDNSESVAREGAAEFEAVLRDLDAADARLRETLERLRATVIEASLRPQGDGEREGDEDDGEGQGRRSLVDFVDETGVQGLMAKIKESIDASGQARREFEESNAAFGEDIFQVKALLPPPKTGNGLPRNGDVWQGLESPVPEILQGMEEHAKEMADNLESLVRHFDLCVTAIKHTDGGGAAARKITSDMPEGLELGSLGNDDAPPEPISDEERQGMLEILEKDASEVEDVVMEIRDRIADMEASFEQVVAHNDRLVDDYTNTTAAFRLLDEVGSRLPGYIMQSHIFLLRWDEEKAKIEARMEEVEGLREFYDGFLRAYDNLIIEIGRRKTMELKMDKVIQDAMAKVKKLYEEDAMEREAFRQEQGDFLPVDIWPGLMAAPLQYEISPIDSGAGKVPEISKSVIQRAIRRVHGKL